MNPNEQQHTCPSCASPRTGLFYRNPQTGGRYARCASCGLIWLEPEFWPKALSEHYSEVYYTSEYQGRPEAAASFAYRLPLIKRYVKEGGKILEIGAASGEFLHVLKSQGYEVEGVELSSSAAAQGARYGLTIHQGTLKDAALSENSYDAVVLYHMLEHDPDPAALLGEIRSVLRPGGIVLIEVPDPTSLDARLSEKLLQGVLDFPHHLFLFSPRVLRKLLLDTGFAFVHKESSPSFLLASLLRGRGKPASHTTEAPARPQSGALPSAPALERPLKSRLRALVGALLPGMKLTVIARKPTSL